MKKVKYSIKVELSFYGTTEIEDDLYHEIENRIDDEESVACEMIGDCIDLKDPQNWSFEDVYEFNEVK